MSRTSILLAVSWALLLLPASIFAQKSTIKESSEPSGKEAIQSHSSSSSGSSSSSSSGSSSSDSDNNSYSAPKEERVREPKVRSHESEPSHSEESTPSQSYEAPTPSRTETAPTYHARPEPRPKPQSSNPRPSYSNNGGGASPEGNTPRSSESSPSSAAINDYGAGAVSKPMDDPLPGVHPIPLPEPLTPTDARPTADHQGTIVLDDDAPPRPPLMLHGIVLSAPARPNYHTLGLTPRPITVMTPVTVASPKPTPTLTPPLSSIDQSSGAFSSDPYSNSNFQTTSSSTDYIGSVGAVSLLAPELACLYLASDSLVSYYRNPKWCVTPFDRAYAMSLQDYLQCYRRLDSKLVEPWMWPCYLTFEEEYQFWSEECANGDAGLMVVRDLMRAKAILVPQLLIDVDVTKSSDWAYVDTAFSASTGGRNYYAAMRTFAPDSLLPVLQNWVRDYPVILKWPSYVTLQNFYATYFRSDIWLMLRTKAVLDHAAALGEADEVEAHNLAENAAWLCLALLLVDRKDAEVQKLKTELKDFLRQNPAAWKASVLRLYLD